MGKQLIPESEFQTVIPSSDGTLTVRTLNTESPSNSGLLVNYQLLNTSPIILDPNNPNYNKDLLDNYDLVVDEIQTLPFSGDTCLTNLETETLISSRDQLFLAICDVLIRFDTNPDYYQKEDFASLIRMLVRSLVHLYNVTSLPVPYKITESPYILSDVIQPGYMVKTIMVYNNEDFAVTMNLGYSVDGQDLLTEETIESKSWTNIAVGRVLSVTDAVSLYFDCQEMLTTNGIYVVVDNNYYFTV